MGLISRVSSRTYRTSYEMTIEEQQRVFESTRVHDDGDEEEDEDDEDEEEEMVDPLDIVRDKCNALPQGVALAAELAKCTERVENAGDESEETCTQELFDFLHHRDHCVGPKF